MNKFLHIGFDTYIDSEKIILITACDVDKLRREMKKRDLDKNSSKYWNATGGKDTKTVILMDDGMIVVSAINPDTLVGRYEEMIKGGAHK